jgi:hypothetical protein
MVKRTILPVLVVFVVWSVMDFIIHGLLLQSTYEATANLWRPMDEMNMGLIYIVTLLFTTCFVVIYGLLVGEKSLASGIKFGVLFGLAIGVSMGFGSYSSIPIPLSLAWSWFLASWVKAIVGGAIVGLMVKA